LSDCRRSDALSISASAALVIGKVRLGAGSARLLELKAKHLYEVRPRKDHRGVDLISNAQAFT
jgi:hypothetical protein